MRVSPAQSRRRPSRLAAFTLIELLTVIAIIGILAAITFGIVAGAQQRAAIQQTRVELAALSTALEAYKKHYGDYPRITTTTAADGALQLFQALNGQRGPKGDALSPRQKAFLDASRFTLEDDDAAVTANNRLLDPWGNAYRYLYNPASASWNKRPFLLFSLGPTVAASAADDVSSAMSSNGVAITDGAYADNIYANQ